MFCEKCGSKIEGNVNNCPNCGAPVNYNNTQASPVKQKNSPFAIASLVCTIVGIFISTYIVLIGLILAIIAVIRSKKDGTNPKFAKVILIVTGVIFGFALIAALFSNLLWPTIKNNIMENTYCSILEQGECTENTDGTYSCSYKEEDGETWNFTECSENTDGTYKCNYKGENVDSIEITCTGTLKK